EMPGVVGLTEAVVGGGFGGGWRYTQVARMPATKAAAVTAPATTSFRRDLAETDPCAGVGCLVSWISSRTRVAWEAGSSANWIWVVAAGDVLGAGSAGRKSFAGGPTAAVGTGWDTEAGAAVGTAIVEEGDGRSTLSTIPAVGAGARTDTSARSREIWRNGR